MKKFFKTMFLTLLVITIVAGAVAGGIFFFRGSGKNEKNEKSKTIVAKAQTEFKFNPHVRPKQLANLYPEEYWEAAFNLIDALRKGEDTFKCKSQEAYDWASNPCTMIDIFQPGSYVLLDSFKQPGEGYKDGVGKIFYAMDKQEFLKKEAAYERDLMKVVNDNVKPDYTDFEKCMALFEYICKNCKYAYDDTDESVQKEEVVFGRPLYLHKGICCELGDFYTTMLLQCGVDAVSVTNDSDGDDVGYHSWTMVTLNGKHYHCDPTWGLASEYDGTFYLQYFMMTDANRDESGFNSKKFQFHCLKPLKVKCSDTRFAKLHEGTYLKIDRKKKLLYYGDLEGKKQSFKYEGK